MSRDYRLFLDDIRQYAEKVVRYTSAMSLQAFLDDGKTFDAVLRNLEIIGEAAKNVPEEVRLRYPHVPWQWLLNLADTMLPRYYCVTDEILWDIIQNHVPRLLKQFQQVIAEEDAAE